ncbi:MAG: vWA domain-containing protein [Flavobacteriales bacterium]
MFVIDNIQYVWLFLAFIPLLGIYLYFARWRKQKQALFAESELWKKLNPRHSKRKIHIKFILYILMFSFGILALMNPKIGSKLKTLKRQGVDVVFVMDVSKSMLAEDIAPSRLEQSKHLVSRLLDRLVSDRIGMVVYAGKAYPQLPLTSDYSAARLYLNDINTDIVPSHGTDVESAIRMALDYFKTTKEQKNQCIVLLSDGEDHENTSLDWLSVVDDSGIPIHTISLGKTSGAPIPIKTNNRITSYKKDRQGEVVITKMNPVYLSEIAEKTDGEFLNGNDSRTTVDQVVESIENMEKGESETELFDDYEDQFQWFIAAAMFFLVLILMLGDGKTMWLRKLNI